MRTHSEHCKLLDVTLDGIKREPTFQGQQVAAFKGILTSLLWISESLSDIAIAQCKQAGIEIINKEKDNADNGN